MQEQAPTTEKIETPEKKFIKWVDFNVPYATLKLAFNSKFDTVEALSYLALKNGNVFGKSRATDVKRLKELTAEKIDFHRDNKYFKYYLEAFSAVFGGILEDDKLVGYFPLAKGHWYNHYDDFGSSRNYGFKRTHLGHDIMGSVGAPIVAVEGGTIAELGWNRFGGWRVGIRSECGKRYHYYAHLRKNKPFAEGLEKGQKVKAGEHIGYLGNTGYSYKENTNMKQGKPHLHYGMQLIFDESQVDNNEIWVDVYGICQLLSQNRAVI